MQQSSAHPLDRAHQFLIEVFPWFPSRDETIDYNGASARVSFRVDSVNNLQAEGLTKLAKKYHMQFYIRPVQDELELEFLGFKQPLT